MWISSCPTAMAMIANGQSINLTTDAYPGVKFVGKDQPRSIRAWTPARATSSGGHGPQPEQKLLPGMFTRVAVIAGDVKQYLTLPQTAITYTPYGATVFLAQKKAGGSDKDLIAQQSFVTLGLTRGDQVAVLKGVSEGTWSSTSGQLKADQRRAVIVDNSVLPANDPRPSPQEQ